MTDFDDNTAASGRVFSVRVFTDRAAITRIRTVPATSPAVAFAPLPLDIDPRTLRARARSKDGQSVKLLGVESEVIYRDPAGPRAEAAEQRVGLEEAIARLDEDRSSDEREGWLLAEYKRLVSASLSSAWLDRDPEFGKWDAALDRLQAREVVLAVRSAASAYERESLVARLTQSRAAEARLGQPEALGLKVTVRVDFGSAASVGSDEALEVALTYVTGQARWSPIYDVRHHPASEGRPEHVVLTALALVTQSTGEDWNDIELVATTARPPLAEPPPELSPICVAGRPGGEVREVVSTTEAVAFRAGATGVAAKVPVVDHAAPGLVQIPSSGRPVRVELFSGQLSSRAQLEVAPRERPVAQLVAELTNETGRTLLPGPVYVFRGPNYAGRTTLDHVAPRERFRLALGTDASVRVRRALRSMPEKTALVTGSVSLAFEARTTVENLSGSDATVLLRDRVPVSRTEQASVKVTQVDRATDIEPETGLTSLSVTLPPRTAREVTLSFRVVAPRGFRITPPDLV